MDMSTVEELVATADPARWRAGDAWLAGGTVLFSYGSASLRRLLDLTTAGWPDVTVTEDGLEIAATCTVARLHALPDELAAGPADDVTGDGAGPGAAGWPALALVRPCCEAFVASFKIWNVSTVGGNLCTSLPAGPMTSLTAALDGEAEVWSPDGTARRLPVTELVTGDGRNALRPGELLRAVRLPAAALRGRTAFRRLSLTTHGRSGVLVVGRLDRPEDGGALTVTVTAATTRPVPLRFPADALPDAPALAAALAAAVPDAPARPGGDAPAGTTGHEAGEADVPRDGGPEPARWHDDVHGLPAWRRDMTYRLAEEVRAELLGDAPAARPAPEEAR